MSKKKVYIIGAISSDPNYLDKFASASEKIAKLGYEPVTVTSLPEKLHNVSNVNLALEMIEQSDIATYLPCWQDTVGATMEYNHALILRKKMVAYEDFVRKGKL